MNALIMAKTANYTFLKIVICLFFFLFYTVVGVFFIYFLILMWCCSAAVWLCGPGLKNTHRKL